MTVKELKELSIANVQVLIPAGLLYDVYHSHTDMRYVYVDGTDFDDWDVDFFEIAEHEENTINVYAKY